MLFSRISLSLSPRAVISIPTTRALSTTSFRWNNPTPHSNPGVSSSSPSDSGSNSFRDVASRYRVFVGPFAKVFLGAIFTYQVIYWTWLKLEMDEAKAEKNQEVAALEKTARGLTNESK